MFAEDPVDSLENRRRDVAQGLVGPHMSRSMSGRIPKWSSVWSSIWRCCPVVTTTVSKASRCSRALRTRRASLTASGRVPMTNMSLTGPPPENRFDASAADEDTGEENEE